ncbi:MAG: hypothetical protein FJZ16_07795, partial [Candidatus Omnitrophica bacterium]|nr:hypothetical protein [Candidatus Omnitrophota bacterium]
MTGRIIMWRSRCFLLGYFVASMLIVLTTISVTVEAAEERFSFSLLDAGEKGVFNIGPGQGKLTHATDEIIQKEILKFDYSVPGGSIIGVWTKGYPSTLRADTVDMVRAGVRVLNEDQIEQVSVKLEIKGAIDIQTIPLNLKPGWNSIRELINWNTIGSLKEVVFVISPMAVNPAVVKPVWYNPMEASLKEGTKQVSGALYFDLEFGRITFLKKHFTLVKVYLVVVSSLFLALMVAFFGRLFGRYRSSKEQRAMPDEIRRFDLPKISPRPYVQERGSPLSRLKWDFLYGVVAVLIIGAVLWIYFLGMMCPLDTNFCFLTVGLISAVISELLKFRLIRKHLTPIEVFQNVLLTGLLAASSS